MGQAKNRGTYEQRVAQAKDRQVREAQAHIERMDAERKAQIEEQLGGPIAGGSVSIRRGPNRVQVLALAALLGGLAVK